MQSWQHHRALGWIAWQISLGQKLFQLVRQISPTRLLDLLPTIFNNPSQDTFKKKLSDAGFYTSWKEKIGEETWSLLEKYTGKIG